MDVEALRAIVRDQPPRILIEELAPESPTLKEMNEAFFEVAKHCAIFTYHEMLKTKSVQWDVCEVGTHYKCRLEAFFNEH